MSTAECKEAKQRRSVSIALFAAGAIMLVISVVIILISAYITDPLLDAIASFMWSSGMLIVIFIVAVVLLIIATYINVMSNKTLVTCILK